MSSHIVKATILGREYEIQMGWDQRCGWYYLVISPVENDSDEEDIDYLYSNLDEPQCETRTLGDYVAVCRGFGVTIPQVMLDGIEEDRRLRRTNNRQHYGHL